MSSHIKYYYLLIFLLFSPAILSAQIFSDGILRYKVMDRNASACEVMGPVVNEFEGDIIIQENAVNNSTSYKVLSIRNRVCKEGGLEN